MQIGGISIIEYGSYEVFSECKCLKFNINKRKSTFGSYTHIAADKIYSTNENRRYASQNDIRTNFIQTGVGKDDKATKQIKASFNEEISTRLEGGIEKEHNLLAKNKARSLDSEQV
ncbi:hypothetical protein [Emticicia sp. 17c]|uniref:hypothetical protein n=1 Tax=Emticicia sp. 17c TaxID=3127704 RepID=UPI00301D7F1D